MLQHRWFLSEQAGRAVDIFETAHDYIDTELTERPDEVIPADDV